MIQQKSAKKENRRLNSFWLNVPLHGGESEFYLLIDNRSFGDTAPVERHFCKKLLSAVNVVDTSDQKNGGTAVSVRIGRSDRLRIVEAVVSIFLHPTRSTATDSVPLVNQNYGADGEA